MQRQKMLEGELDRTLTDLRSVYTILSLHRCEICNPRFKERKDFMFRLLDDCIARLEAKKKGYGYDKGDSL